MRPDTGYGNGSTWGNAKNWASRARQEGFTVKDTPTVGAIGVDENGDLHPLGHVVYVKSYNSTTVTVSEMNYNTSITACTECTTCANARVRTNHPYQRWHYEAYIYPKPPDTTPPTVSFNTPTLNHWYNIDHILSWSVSDSDSGVDYYQWGWNDPTPDTRVDATSGSTTLSVPGQGQHTLYVQAWDNEGNNKLYSVGWFGYDTTTPTTALSLNHGATVTVQSTVVAAQNAQDTGSGVWQTRFSNNGVYWSDWMDYADTLTWGLPAVDGATLNVYAQVRDYAGNESAVVSDTITLDLTPPAPHSADFRLCAATLDAGGGVITSTGFTLVAALGQPLAGNAGFLSNLTGCRPISDPPPHGYELPQTVIASSGGLRSGGNFRLGDTAGQPLASGAQPLHSAGFRLSAGFWGHIAPGASTCITPLSAVSLPGPGTWTVRQPYTFYASVMPLKATPPITYTWMPAPQSGQGTHQATYVWNTPGVYTITLQAENCGGTVIGRYTLTVTDDYYFIYLPLVLRNY